MRSRRLFPAVLTLLIVAAMATPAALYAQPQPGPGDTIQWADWSAHYLKKLRDEGKPVFVFVTAQWDLQSIGNEEAALKHADTVKFFKEREIVALRIDTTSDDPAIKEFMSQHGKTAPPLAVYYPPKAKPVVLPDTLNGPKSVTTVIEKADKDAGVVIPQPTPPTPVDPQPTPPVDPQPTPPVDPQPTPPVDPQPTHPVDTQ
ncbi:MAG: thioredoxin family protein, partial [Planctomycetota bacterium]